MAVLAQMDVARLVSGSIWTLYIYMDKATSHP